MTLRCTQVLWTAVPVLLAITPLQAQGEELKVATRSADRYVTFLELPERRREAVRGLLALGRAAVPALIRTAKHPNPEFALISMHVLRDLGPVAMPALPTLLELARSRDEKIARAAVWARARLQPSGRTLVTVYQKGLIVEFDAAGKSRVLLENVSSPREAERLANGNLLVTQYREKKIVEYTPAGEAVWSHQLVGSPLDADRLASGNTLICESSKIGARGRKVGGRVVEIDRTGKVVWTCTLCKQPHDADRLPGGNTLIAGFNPGRVVEVDHAGKVIWEVKVAYAVGASRLANGNTLVTRHFKGDVLEIDGRGKTVFRLEGLDRPKKARRLPNGNTLVAEFSQFREFDAAGKEVARVELKAAIGSLHRYSP